MIKKYFNKRRNYFFIKIFVILFLFFFVFTIKNVEASNFDGLPYLCPLSINQNAVYSYCQELYENFSFVKDSKGLCNGKDCTLAKQELIDSCVDSKIDFLNNKIVECNEKFNSLIKVYIFDWSLPENKWSKEMKDYKSNSVNTGSFGIIMCLDKNNYRPDEYDEEYCNYKVDENKLSKIMKKSQWKNNLCSFEKNYHEKLIFREKEYNECLDSCNEKIDISHYYDCNEYNCWQFDKSYCSKCYSDEEYESAQKEYYKCTSKCDEVFEKKTFEAYDFYDSNCLAYSFYFYDYLYNLYSEFYGNEYSDSYSKFYNLKETADFLRGPVVMSDSCPEEYVFKEGSCILDVNEKEKVNIFLDKKVLDLSKDKELKGSLKYECEGDCSGEMIVLNVESNIPGVSFKKRFSKNEGYLTKENPVVDFVLTPIIDSSALIFNDEKIFVTLSTKGDKKKFELKLEPINKISVIKNFKEPVKQGSTVSFTVKINGPNNYDYTYVLSSALDGVFYYNGKESLITSIISSDSNSITVSWKTPMISRKVNVKDFYIDELGELSMDSLSILASSFSETLSATTVSKGFKVSSELTDKGFGTLSVINDWSMTDPVPTGISVIGLLNENPIVGLGSSLTYATYKAYNRATERFEAFNSDKNHVYDVPIFITVFPKSYPEVKEKFNIKVEAPEVILE